MKKIVLALILLCNLMIANEKMMSSILKNVLIKDVNATLNVLNKFHDDLKTEKKREILHNDFKLLVQSWKKVETFYVAASFNEEAIDLPRYVDVFHNLKENLHVQMQRAIESKDAVEIALFKNSFKTINALEYVLFDKSMTERKRQIALFIVQRIKSNVEEILYVYKNDSKRFLSEFKWSNDVIINMLIDSSFKLRDWRVGDSSGHSRKYKGKANNTRAEYYKSNLSKEAIETILLTHQSIMNSKEYDFGDMLNKNGFKKEVALIQQKINESLGNLKYLKDDNFEDKNIAKLYVSLDELHKAYYLSLVNAVGVSTKILDADGD